MLQRRSLSKSINTINTSVKYREKKRREYLVQRCHQVSKVGQMSNMVIHGSCVHDCLWVLAHHYPQKFCEDGMRPLCYCWYRIDICFFYALQDDFPIGLIVEKYFPAKSEHYSELRCIFLIASAISVIDFPAKRRAAFLMK